MAQKISDQLDGAGRQLVAAQAFNVPDALAIVLSVEVQLAELRTALVVKLRNEYGYSWAKVAAELGISKQGAMKVYGPAAEDDFNRGMRAERQAANRAAYIAAELAEARAELPAPSSPVALPAVDVPLELEALPARPTYGTDPAPLELEARRLYVVPCGAGKLGHAAPARELYTGAHFARTLRIVEAAAARDGAEVRILSAQHGLVDPDAELAPYDTLVADLSDSDRVALELHVAAQLEALGATEVTAWVPKAYWSVLSIATAMILPAARPALSDAFAGARGIGDQRAILGALEAASAA